MFSCCKLDKRTIYFLLLVIRIPKLHALFSSDWYICLHAIHIACIYPILIGAYHLTYRKTSILQNNCSDLHLLLAPTFKKPKRLFVRRHCFFPQLGAPTVHHKLINLPIKICIKHKKHSQFIRVLYPNKLEVFIGSAKKVYRFAEPLSNQ